MLRLSNQTPFSCEGALQVDHKGQEVWVVLIKGTFRIQDGLCEVAAEQEPVCLTDVFIGEVGRSSIRYACELTFAKPGTDVVVNGHAWAPKGQAVTETDVELRVATVYKRLRVFGERVWRRSLMGVVPGAPQKFDKIPLTYERAFGGVDAEGEQGEARNPIGCGFALSAQALLGRSMPNIEYPDDLIHSAKSRPRPAGLGFLAPHWQPRQGLTGTYDQQWKEQRAPLWPADFDPRFFLSAPVDQIISPGLLGGERVELRNLSPTGELAFYLPRIRLGCSTFFRGTWVPHAARIGSVIIEPDLSRVLVLWHTTLPCHRQRFAISTTVIAEKPWVPKGSSRDQSAW